MYYICNLQTVVPREERKDELRNAHLEWLREAHGKGQLALSGPRPGHTDGHYIIKAESQEEAEGIAQADPHTVAGYTRFELVPWDIRRGSLAID